jgi:hypothetical protein
VVKAINKRCSKDLQAAVDDYCKFWVYIMQGESIVEKRAGGNCL